jgi:hypothetical protein
MKGAHAGVPAESFTRPAGIVYVPVDRETGLRATVESSCPTPILEAFIEGTEPTTPCSEKEHVRHRLPYFLQSFDINRSMELRIEPEIIVRLIQEGVGDVELMSDGRELLLQGQGDEPARTVRLDLSRRERRDLFDLLMEAEFAAFDDFMVDDPIPEDDRLEPVGVDGRPATIVPIRYD